MTVLGPRTGERTIVDNDVACQGLAPALAVNLVMLLDPEAPALADASATSNADKRGEVAPNAMGEAPVVATSKSKDLQAKPQQVSYDVLQSAEGQPHHIGSAVPRARATLFRVKSAFVGSTGYLNQPALGMALGLEGYHRSGFGLDLEALRLWSTAEAAQGGQIKFGLWGGLVGPCYRHRAFTSSAVYACLRLGLGQQRARATGYQRARNTNVTSAVLGPSLGLAQRVAGGFTGFIAVSTLFQLSPQYFSVVDGSRSESQSLVVSSAPRVGLMAELGFSFGGEDI